MRLSLSTISLSLIVSGCQTPPDIFVCKKLDPVVVKTRNLPEKTLGSPTCKANIGEDSCGYCTYTISDKSFFVGNELANHHNGKSWNQLMDRSVILPAVESYAPLKRYIINQCRSTNCDSTITNWRFKLESLDQLFNAK